MLLAHPDGNVESYRTSEADLEKILNDIGGRNFRLKLSINVKQRQRIMLTLFSYIL